MRKRTSIQALLNRILSIEALILLVLTIILVLTKTGKNAKEADSVQTSQSLNQPSVTSGSAITITPTSVPVPTVDPIPEDDQEDHNQTESDDLSDTPNGTDNDAGADSETGNGTDNDAGADSETGNGTDNGAGTDSETGNGTDNGAGTDPDNSNPEESSAAASAEGSISLSTFLSKLSKPLDGTVLQKEGQAAFTYYMQTDSRWANKIYGEGSDTIQEYGCGPTCLAMVISSMTSMQIDPVQMCQWSYENGYWFPQSGSLHTLIPDAVKAAGLQVEGVSNSSGAADKLTKALNNGSMVIVLMGKGSFTNSGHFIVLRGITADGKVLVGDPASEETTSREWEMDLIVSEAKSWAAANGPFWIISK